MKQTFSSLAGLATAVVGVVIWAMTLAIATPAADNVRPVSDFSPDLLLIWAHELREAALLLTVCGFLLFVQRFRGALAISVLAGVLLFIGDFFLDAKNVSGIGPMFSVIGGAGVIGVIAFGLIPLTDELDQRLIERRRASLAVFAAFCAPVVLFNSQWSFVTDSDAVPWQFLAGTAIVAVGFAALSAASAATATSRYWALAVPAVMTAVSIAGLFGAPTQLGVGLSLPFAALATVAVRRNGWLHKFTSTRTVIAGSLAAVAFAVPVILVALVPANVLGGWFLAALHEEIPSDGLPYLPGALIVAILVSVAIMRTRQNTAPPRVGDAPNSGEKNDSKLIAPSSV
ncbi:MAG TPA: hypothetical protein VHU91_05975 [Mycobacteriales bacterium]|jgi:hypothetical protein|nr:hypothetical protein [Mycobacteriales bacterium]